MKGLKHKKLPLEKLLHVEFKNIFNLAFNIKLIFWLCLIFMLLSSKDEDFHVLYLDKDVKLD